MNYNIEPADLENKINEYIEWYCENVSLNKGIYESCFPIYSDSDYQKTAINLNLFLEKMIKWYNDVYFKKSDFKTSFEKFKESLSFEEAFYLLEPVYPREILLKTIDIFLYFILDEEGIIEKSIVKIPGFNKKINLDYMTLPEAVTRLKQMGAILYNKNPLKTAIKEYNQAVELKRRTLFAVVCKILLKADAKIGPQMAYSFAKDFDLDYELLNEYFDKPIKLVKNLFSQK